MSKYLVRIELHEDSLGDKPRGSNYKELHAAMVLKGFSRTVVGTLGERKLPNAEYLIDGEYTIRQVRKLAKSAAGSVWTPFSVLTVLVADMCWHNLKET